MTAPNTGTITASIERSLQNCCLNHHQSSSSSSNSGDSNNSAGVGRTSFVAGRSSTSDLAENLQLPDNTLELNSEIRLPYYWEQCLDLKTGEVYYINWRTGMKSQEDPRTNPETDVNNRGLLCSEDDDDDNDDSSYESEGSFTEESSPPTSREQWRQYSPPLTPSIDNKPQPSQVLVVAGCKSCFMYFMVPRQVEVCPKCFGQLLHLDRSENGSP